MTRAASTRPGPVAAATQATSQKVAERLQAMRPGTGTNPTLPDDLVEVGYVGGAYGIRGWIKVQLHGDADALLNARTWWLKPAAGALATSADWRVFPVGTSREHSGTVVAGSPAAPDRNVAEALRGYAVWVSRADFPEPDDDEFYWVDLIGASVSYMWLSTKATLTTQAPVGTVTTTTKVRINPLASFLSVGYRF